MNDKKDKEILTLRAELNRAHDEYSFLASRKPGKAKENNMAKFNLDVQNVTLGGAVVVGSAIINVEVSDDLFTACVNNLTKLTEIMFSPPKSTCTCHVNDEDKRPYGGKKDAYLSRKPTKPDNAFAPMATE